MDLVNHIFHISQSVNLPWSLQQYKEHIALDYTVYIVNDYGFVGCSILFGEAEITNIAVHRHHHRNGYAQQLMNELKQKLRENNVTVCFLEVRQSNDVAKRFYEKENFECIGVRKNYYHNPSEHALIYRLELK